MANKYANLQPLVTLFAHANAVRARTHGVENLPNNTIICQIFVLFGKYYFYLGTLFAHVNAVLGPVHMENNNLPNHHIICQIFIVFA